MILESGMRSKMSLKRRPVNHWYSATAQPGPCEKISVNSKTVIKNDIWEWLENSRSDFFTVYNGYCNLSRFFGYQPAGMERSGMESG